MTRLGARIGAYLADPRFVWVAALVAVVLSLPSLASGLQLDDHIHRFSIALWKEGQPLGPWWDLYRAAEGDEALTGARVDAGFTPWWTHPDLRIKFFRPLAAATHLVDYSLWPRAAAWMHAENILLYGALVVGVGRLQHRLAGPRAVTGFAVLLFAIDEAHATPVGWIAQRNAILTGLGVVATLLLFVRTRSEGWRRGHWLGPLTMLAGLLCGEATLVVLAYLGAYVLLVDRGPWRERILALLPYLLVIVAWRLAYDAMGYGARGSGVYVDPGREPVAFLHALVERWPALLLASLSWPGADDWVVAEAPTWPLAWQLAGATALAFAVALAGALRRRPEIRMMAVALPVALVPLTTALASDRVLLPVSIAGSLLVAQAVAGVVPRGGWASRIRAALTLPIALVLLVRHAVLAPLEYPKLVAGLPAELEAQQRAGVDSLPSDPALAEQELVIVNAPPTFVGAYLWLLRVGTDKAVPKRLRVLGSTFAPVIVQRHGKRRLVLQPVGGYLGDPFTRIVRGPQHPIEVGFTQETGGMKVEVLGASEGRPTSVRFTFDARLESRRYRFVTWKQGRFTEFPLPAPGRAAAIPGRLTRPGGLAELWRREWN